MLTFDDHARPLLYTILLKIYNVPTLSPLDRNALPFWTWYSQRLSKANEATQKRRATTALKALRERPGWPHRQEFIRRFHTDDPEAYFSEDPSRFTRELKEYVLRQEYIDSALFCAPPDNLTFARGDQTDDIADDAEDYCIICLDVFDEGVSRTTCLLCQKPFHGRCMMRWMNQSRNCPHCRGESWVNVSELSQEDMPEQDDREGSPFSEYTVTSHSSDDNGHSLVADVDEFRESIVRIEQRLESIENTQNRILQLLERHSTR